MLCREQSPGWAQGRAVGRPRGCPAWVGPDGVLSTPTCTSGNNLCLKRGLGSLQNLGSGRRKWLCLFRKRLTFLLGWMLYLHIAWQSVASDTKPRIQSTKGILSPQGYHEAVNAECFFFHFFPLYIRRLLACSLQFLLELGAIRKAKATSSLECLLSLK